MKDLKIECPRCSTEYHETMRKQFASSWFIRSERICPKCLKQEASIKQALWDRGCKDMKEGCGYIPDPNALR